MPVVQTPSFIDTSLQIQNFCAPIYTTPLKEEDHFMQGQDNNVTERRKRQKKAAMNARVRAEREAVNDVRAGQTPSKNTKVP